MAGLVAQDQFASYLDRIAKINDNLPSIALTCAFLYISYKAANAVHFLYHYNRIVKDVPVNPCFPLILGCFQNIAAIPERSQLFAAIGKAANEMDTPTSRSSHDQVQSPHGLTKIYVLPFIPILIASTKTTLAPIFQSSKAVNKSFLFKTVISRWTFGIDNILTSDRATWKEKRRIMVKTMHTDYHSGYVQVMKKHVRVMIEKLKSASNNNSKVPIELSRYIYDLNISISNEVILGQSIDNPDHRKDFTSALHRGNNWVERRLASLITNETMWSIYCFITGYDGHAVLKKYQGLVEHYVKERMNALENNLADQDHETERLLIDTLIDLHKEGSLTFRQLKAEVMLFHNAATDTSSNAVLGALSALSHPDCHRVNEKLYQEIEKNFPTMAEFEHLDLDTLNNMQYLDCVVKETLRMFAPITTAFRSFQEPMTFHNGFTIEATPDVPIECWTNVGAASVSEINKISGHPEAFKDFRPERFEGEYSASCYSYGPFMRGVRDCIGKPFAYLTMKIQILYFMKNFRSELVKRTPDDEHVHRPMVLDMVRVLKNQPVFNLYER